MLKNLYFFLFVSVVNCSFGQQDNWQFDQISLNEGLSNTYVSEIFKDSKGFIWMATANGLNRYNAYEIEKFVHDPEDPNSISSNMVSSILEDSQGNIWVGTGNGLNRYDRKTGNFKRYKGGDEIKMEGLPGFVYCMAEDLDGNIWLGSSSFNLAKFNVEKEEIEYVQWPDEPWSRSGSRGLIRDIIVDDNNNVWAGTNGAGVLRYDINNDIFTCYHYTVDSLKHDPRFSFVFSTYQDKTGQVWAGSFLGGLFKFDEKENQFNLIPNPNNQDATTKNGIQSIGEDQEGNLLLGANGGGLFVFNPKTEEFIKNYTFDALRPSTISDDFIVDIYADNTGIFWFGTENGGAFRYDPLSRKFKSFKKEGNSKSDLPGNTINDILVEKNGGVWLATENNGFAKLDRNSGEYEQFRIRNVSNEGGNTFVNSVASDKLGGIWVGAEMGGLSHFDHEGNLIKTYAQSYQGEVPGALHDHDVQEVIVDSDTTVWVGFFRGFAALDGEYFNQYCSEVVEEGRYCYEPVNVIYDYDEDWLIVGYSQDGIKFFNKKTRTFGSQFLHSEQKGSISDDRVHAILCDSRNMLWIGTKYGLNKFDISDSTFSNYTSKNGLSNDIVLGILEDHEGNLWISTAYGLNKFDPNEESFQNYYVEDGLQSNVFRSGASCKSHTGELFFGGVEGFNAFHPYDLVENPHPPSVVFTDFQIHNLSVKPGEDSPIKIQIEEAKEIELDYSQKTFSFEFAALSYTVPEKNEYSYILEGFDDDWNFIGKRRYISFTNIPPGEYVLKVKACNNDGLWNETPTEISIIIHPPFWQTVWFRALVIFLVVGSIYLIYRRRVRAIERQNKILEQQVTERTAQVVEQKNEVEKQKELVEEKNRDLTDSIRYAKRIQDSFLPDIADIKEKFEDAFVLFKPKDIVSGDFYWSHEIDDKIFVAVADCTGHGVPGAMVSVLGNNGLHHTIKDRRKIKPGEILDDLRDYVLNALEKKGEVVRDGMDICLCVIDPQSGILEYAGANNPLWIARNGEILETKADKQPIGKHSHKKDFSSQSIQLEKGDWVFMFSDGFPDQFGGPKGKKYKYATLKRTLLNFDDKQSQSFTDYLDEEFEDWRGVHEQIDDVCILGIKY